MALAYEAGFQEGRSLIKCGENGKKRYDLMWVPED